jgi:ribosomal protein S18 acetylase RimI-like enzyme
VTISLDDLQGYLRQVAALQYETVTLPGLTLYLHPTDELTFFNYAIPERNWASGLDGSLARMRAECAGRKRRPRFEFIDEYAPGLGVALRSAGFVEEARQALMVCTAETYRTAPPVAGLQIDELGHTARVAEMPGLLAVPGGGFGPGGPERTGGPEEPNEREAELFAQTLGQGRAFVARLRGEAVAAGMYSAPLPAGDQGTRIAELTGQATLAPYRRQGIATALAARASHTAFQQGVDVICLVAADERAGHIYERVGYHARATMLAYVDPAEARADRATE